MTRRIVVVLAVLALLAVACGDDSPVESGSGPDPTTTSSPPVGDPDSPAARLAAARGKWAVSGPTSYTLTTQELCFCPETIWIDTVVDGEVVTHVAGPDEGFFDPGERTMGTLFDEIEAAIDMGYARLDLDFDDTTGAVERYWVDVSEQMADEEHGVEVVALTPLDDRGDIDVRTLTQDYGCGYGFAIGSPDQDLALVIGFDGGVAPDVTAPINFPADEWSGVLTTGTDLFSNWCDDVIEESEPVPLTTERWTLVAGTLTIGLPGTIDDGLPVSANLSGGVAESSAGETMDLGQIAFVNDCWGCFAG